MNWVERRNKIVICFSIESVDKFYGRQTLCEIEIGWLDDVDFINDLLFLFGWLFYLCWTFGHFESIKTVLRVMYFQTLNVNFCPFPTTVGSYGYPTMCFFNKLLNDCLMKSERNSYFCSFSKQQQSQQSTKTTIKLNE